MNKVASSSLVLGIMMAIGIAKADPLTLSAADMEQVTSGGLFDLNALLNEDIFKNIQVNVTKTITSIVVLVGHVGDAEASAKASGPNTLSETVTIANANYQAGTSDSYSQSIAAANADVDPTPDPDP